MPSRRLKSLSKALKRRKPAPTLAKLKKKAWGLLSECIRREAAQLSGISGQVVCYTCGAVHNWKEIHAAHAIPGRTGATLLDEEIIRPGCYRCNVGLHGNYPVFVTKLIRERSEAHAKLGTSLFPLADALDWWEGKLQSSRQVKKWNRQDLEEKIESYKARLAAL